jgi:hypothetical protein
LGFSRRTEAVVRALPTGNAGFEISNGEFTVFSEW